MARIKADLAALRERLVWDWFTVDPPLSVKAANDLLEQKPVGNGPPLGRMNLHRIYELKRAAGAKERTFPARTKIKETVA